MRRILFWGVLAASLLLLQPSPASLGQEKHPTSWTTVGDFKVLKLWEQPSGPTWPQIAVLHLPSERFKELKKNPLAFYKEHKLFEPTPSDRHQGHHTFKLIGHSAKSKDDLIVVVVHDVGTWSAVAGFEVSSVKYPPGDQK